MRMVSKSKMHKILYLLYAYLLRCQAETIICDPGTYKNTTTNLCVACEGNTYCAVDDICINSCTSCPTSTTVNTNHTNCLSGSCQICPKGYFCSGGTNIAGCPTGTYGSDIGFSLETDCTNCAEGTYSNAFNSTVCTQCSIGKYIGSIKQSACKMCAEGTYQSSIGSSTCSSCGKGTYNTGTGMISSSDNCTLCPAGTFAVGTKLVNYTDCTLCDQGTYATGKGYISSRNCTSCAAGSFSTGYGMTSFNTSCRLCYPGSYQPNTSSYFCNLCPQTTYLNFSGAVNASQCSYCPGFSRTFGEGANSIQLCSCEKGYYGSNATSCTPCPAGRYANATGMLQCIQCPVNTYDPSTATIRSSYSICSNVPDYAFSAQGSTNYSCFAGYYDEQSPAQCTKCVQGLYSDNGATECKDCTNGNTPPGLVNAGIKSCTCNLGYYKATNTSECQLCPPGYYCIGGGAVNQPISCAMGRNTSAQGGASSFIQCICKGGWYGDTLNAACATCPSGSWCPGGI